MVCKFAGSDEDLITEGLLALDKAITQFDPDRGCKFSTFANSRIRWAMSRSRSRAGPNIENSSDGEIYECGDDPTERTIDRLFWKGALRAALTNQEERVVRLLIWDQLSESEVAEQLGISETNVWVIYQRALDKLRAYVRGSY